MVEIILATLTFTVVVLLLVGLLLGARHKLVATGEVSIVVNDDASNALKVGAGGTLLGALAQKSLFIPSACGGKGSCGVCGVVVREGGGALLPTETGFISPGRARQGYRLACQVKVKTDMKIELAPEIFSLCKWQCRVVSNRNVSTFIKELKLKLPEDDEVPFRAGGYMQIEAPAHELSFGDFGIEPEYREEWDQFNLWRFRSVVSEPLVRAYSMANFPLEKGILMFTIRIVFPPDYRDDIPPGKMSSWLFNLKPGDPVTVCGPYGEFFARETDSEMCFVAAGAGMAPMRSHIFDQLIRLKSQRRITFWYSARNLKEAFYIDEFDKLAAGHPNFRWHLVLSEPRTEDHWTGPVGLVRHNVLRDMYIKNHPAPEETPAPQLWTIILGVIVWLFSIVLLFTGR